MARPSARLLGTTLLAAALLTASAAGAQEAQTVTLLDGTTVSGEVLEYVAGDHVTLRLAGGEALRIAWDQLASPPRAPRLGGSTLPELTAPPPDAPPPGWTPAPWSPRLGELRPAVERDPTTGWSPRVTVGVQSGYASPFGYVALVADYFPSLRPWARGIGLELTVALPVSYEPVTLGETLLFEIGLGPAALGFGGGFAQSFAPAIIPGDHPGVISSVHADLSHLAWHFTPALSARARWGLAALLNGGYCATHPEACPELANVVPFYGDVAVLWTFDFGSAPPP